MRKEFAMAGVTVFLWGTSAPVCKVLLADTTNMEVLCCASIFAALSLLAVILVKGQWKELTQYTPKDLGRLCLLGFTGYFLYSAFYYQGITYLDAQVACIVNYLWPIFTVCFACLILKEPFSGAKLLALLLSFGGVIVVMLRPGQGFSFSGNQLKGYLSCILAAALYGLFCNLNKKQGGNQLINMFCYHTLSAVCALVCCLVTGFAPVSGGHIVGFLWLGVFVNAIGYLLWALALQGSSAAAISNFAYGTPAIALLLSHFFLGEPLYVTSILGLALILTGFFLQMYLTNRRKGQERNLPYDRSAT